jgi:hypothetical protein
MRAEERAVLSDIRNLTSIRRAGSRRFPFIEEMHAEGKPLEEALLDAGTSACGRC